MPQNRLTAVGRVEASVVADGLELRVERCRIGLRDAERDAHGRRHADGRGAANHHVANRVGDFHIGLAGDVILFARKAGLVDHDHATGAPLDGFNHE